MPRLRNAIMAEGLTIKVGYKIRYVDNPYIHTVIQIDNTTVTLQVDDYEDPWHHLITLSKEEFISAIPMIGEVSCPDLEPE